MSPAWHIALCVKIAANTFPGHSLYERGSRMRERLMHNRTEKNRGERRTKGGQPGKGQTAGMRYGESRRGGVGGGGEWTKRGWRELKKPQQRPKAH